MYIDGLHKHCTIILLVFLLVQVYAACYNTSRIGKAATYKTLYGALATLPVFLIWMYLAWAVVIFGAVVTAALEEYQQLDKRSLKKIIIAGKPEKRK